MSQKEVQTISMDDLISSFEKPEVLIKKEIINDVKEVKKDNIASDDYLLDEIKRALGKNTKDYKIAQVFYDICLVKRQFDDYRDNYKEIRLFTLKEEEKAKLIEIFQKEKDALKKINENISQKLEDGNKSHKKFSFNSIFSLMVVPFVSSVISSLFIRWQAIPFFFLAAAISVMLRYLFLNKFHPFDESEIYKEKGFLAD